MTIMDRLKYPSISLGWMRENLYQWWWDFECKQVKFRGEGALLAMTCIMTLDI